MNTFPKYGVFQGSCRKNHAASLTFTRAGLSGLRVTAAMGVGVELTLVTTEHGVMLQTKPAQQHKLPAKSLRGFLQHKGEPVPTEVLCKPVEYINDRF